MKRWMLVVAVVSLVGCGASVEDMSGSVRKTQVKQVKKVKQVKQVKQVKDITKMEIVKAKPGTRVGLEDGESSDSGNGGCGEGQVPCGRGCCDSATERCGDSVCHPRDNDSGGGKDGGDKPAEVIGAS
ncbi:MAG TPA: hypothetical protein ENJ18_02275 [Nannocystis exedens]|nr:hypothetical protein [Nannocystis exedens]